MKISLKGKEFELRGIIGKSCKEISSNDMTKLSKTRHHGVIARLCSLHVQTSKPFISCDLQMVIHQHSKVLEYIPKGLQPFWDRDHATHLIPRSGPPNIGPYRYPYGEKSEIECMVEEMLEVGIIRPSQSSLSTLVVMVDKKDSSWHLCLYNGELNKIVIKYKFLVHVINELLDKLHEVVYFTKWNLCLGYHWIRMKE